jgi:hypothetical protein
VEESAEYASELSYRSPISISEELKKAQSQPKQVALALLSTNLHCRKVERRVERKVWSAFYEPKPNWLAGFFSHLSTPKTPLVSQRTENQHGTLSDPTFSLANLKRSIIRFQGLVSELEGKRSNSKPQVKNEFN